MKCIAPPQFELLAHAQGWLTVAKALQLAWCLTDDALFCLLLLSPEGWQSYGALVASLQRWFGQCVQPGLLCNELSNRCRNPGSHCDHWPRTWSAWLSRCMPTWTKVCRMRWHGTTSIYRSLFPTELRVQVQMQYPQTLQAAFEMAVEWEILCLTKG